MASSSSSNNNNKKKSGSSSLIFYGILVLSIFTFISVTFNVWHTSTAPTIRGAAPPHLLQDDWKIAKQKKPRQEPKDQLTREPKKGNVKDSVKKDDEPRKIQAKEKSNNKVQEAVSENNSDISAEHKLSGLNCDAYGGPAQEIAQEMVYWQDIPSDNTYVSPFKKKDRVQYMTFEPDKGGWNNIRMSMETVLAMAYAMGRTLVLPPDQKYYLLDKGESKHKRDFSFRDFFHLESIANEHREGLNIITMTEFLERVAMTGQLVNRETGQVSFPPHNRTNWDGQRKAVITNELDKWLRTVADKNTIWSPEQCMAAFASTTDQAGVDRLQQYFTEIHESKKGFGTFEEYIGKPNPVDAAPKVRMRENWATRKKLCIYDTSFQDATLVHFPMDHSIEGARLLVHFYAFLFFEDWKQDLWMKRFVRDHVRYVDEIQCAAARIVHAIRKHVENRNSTFNGEYNAFHIRRGDFQYRDTRFDADVIYNVSKKELTSGGTVYIATDEKDKSFFKPLADHYDLLFLDDFKPLIEDVNTNYYGMLDQLVASRSKVFFGCWFSTFSSYINRMRGYHADKEHLPGYEDGLVESYYYARKEDKYKMREFYPVKLTFHSREYPSGWRGIDKGIGMMDEVYEPTVPQAKTAT